MAIPNHIIKRIEDQIDIVELVSRYVSLERRGDRFWGCCPFHLEKTPSFSVTPGRGSFYCFGCKKSGGIFQFIMEIEKIGFVEAAHQFANQLGIIIDETDERGEENLQEKKALLLLYQRIVKTFEYCLWNTADGENALRYLRRRGLGEKTIRHYQIGYAPKDKYFLYNFLQKKGYSDKLLSKSGLFSRKYPQFPFFLDRILFPVFQNTGEVVAFSGRLITEPLNAHSPKYLNSPDTLIYNKKQNLFGFYQAKKAIAEQGFMLCEGAMDVCAMYEMGFPQAVASLGTGFTQEQAKILRRITEKGYIIFDNDEAGEKAKKSAIFILEKLNMQVKIVDLEEEKDPGEILQKKNLKGLQKSIDSARIPIEFLIDITARPVPQNAAEAVGVCQAIFPYIQSISSPVIQDEMLRILAAKLNLKEGVVVDEFQRFGKKSIHRLTVGEDVETQDLHGKSLYQFNGTIYELLRIFLEHPHCYAQHGRAIQKRWLDSQESRLVASYLENNLDKISFSLWLEEQSPFDKDIKRYLLQPSHFEPGDDMGQYVQIMLKQLEVRELERECSNLADMIKRAEKRGDSDESVNDLMKDYVLVVQELQQLKAGL